MQADNVALREGMVVSQAWEIEYRSDRYLVFKCTEELLKQSSHLVMLVRKDPGRLKVMPPKDLVFPGSGGLSDQPPLSDCMGTATGRAADSGGGQDPEVSSGRKILEGCRPETRTVAEQPVSTDRLPCHVEENGRMPPSFTRAAELSHLSPTNIHGNFNLEALQVVSRGRHDRYNLIDLLRRSQFHLRCILADTELGANRVF